MKIILSNQWKKSNKEKEADFGYDCEIVKSYEDGSVGANFENTLIADGRFDWPEDDPRFKQIIEETGSSSNDIVEARKEEAKKLEAFREYVDDFKSKLKQARINPFGPLSPMSVYQAKGERGVVISNRFVEQIKYLREKQCEVTVVVPFYDKNKLDIERANVPQIERAETYVEICSKLISELGSSEGLVLELGNETNVSHSTGEMFSGSAREQHASRVDPEAYANFYSAVAQKLKEKHPDIKLAIAGVACYDKNYLKTVLEKIDEIAGGQANTLVDVISYHSYGKFVGETDNEAGFFSAFQIENGQFTGDDLDFNSQNEQMLALAREYGVELRIEEINFPIDDSKRKEHLEKFLALSTRQGVPTKLWPSAVMPAGGK